MTDPGPSPPDPPPAPPRPAFWIRHPRAFTVTTGALIGLAMIAFWTAFHLPGHSPGDDYALYINQARSLIHGDVGETLGNNRYTVENSAWHTFSPYAYPWGLPLLLAPVLAVFGSVDLESGIDYAPLKFVICVCLAVALLALFAVARRRTHVVGAALLVVFFATNFWWVLHTDSVLSEFPFLMCVLLFVWWADTLRERGELLSGAARWRLATLGVLAAYAFHTRREGVGLLLGLALFEAPAVWAGRRQLAALPWRRLAVPWVAWFVTTAGIAVALPSELLPRYSERGPDSDSGLWRIPKNVRHYRALLAEQLGFKDPGDAPIEAFHSATLGAVALGLVVAFAVLGLVLSAVVYWRRDGALVGAFVGNGMFVLASPYWDYRYLMPLMPFILFFAYQGVAIPIRRLARVPTGYPVVLAELAVVGLILGFVPDTRNALHYRSGWTGAQVGPQEPASLELFAAVRAHTRGDDVIVYNRARTMTLYTGRRAVQGGALDFTVNAGDYYVMYLNPDGTPGDYSQYPLTEGEAAELGFEQVWRNESWVLWKTPTD